MGHTAGSTQEQRTQCRSATGFISIENKIGRKPTATGKLWRKCLTLQNKRKCPYDCPATCREGSCCTKKRDWNCGRSKKKAKKAKEKAKKEKKTKEKHKKILEANRERLRLRRRRA